MVNFFKRIFSRKEEIKANNPVKLLEIVAYGFQAHIDESFLELKPNIKISVKNEDIVFELKNGLNDPIFLEFFECGIKLKAAVNNCKKFGVKKLVFIDNTNDTCDIVTPAELEKMKLY